MKKNSVKRFLLAMTLGVAFLGIIAVQNGNSEIDRYALKSPSRVVISVETGWQRDGMVPVCIHMNGLETTLWMKADGRVFADRHLPTPKGERGVRGRELFFLDGQLGQLMSGTERLSGRVYEQNSLRTRIRLEGVAASLELGADCRQAVLDLGGLKIPVRVMLKRGADGAEELCLGDRPSLGLERLLLDRAGQAIFREEIMRLSSDRRAVPVRTCWAQKTSEGESR